LQGTIEMLSMERLARWLPDLVIITIVMAMQVRLYLWGIRSRRVQQSLMLRYAIIAGFVLGLLALMLSIAMKSHMLAHRFDTWWVSWTRAVGLMLGTLTIGLFLSVLLWRRIPSFQPERRALLLTARTALFGAPFAVTGFGVFVERNHFHLREVDLPVRGLPPDLSNLRLMLISDIHLSPFLSESELARIVEMANDCKPHVTFVTGDLISNPGDPLDACLRQLARLKSDAGTYGCLGNHEFFARADEYATREGARLGIQFLRQARTEFRFGGARLSVAGVDYQRKDRPYLAGAEALISPGAVNLLLSHNPDVFPVAAKLGFQAVLAGHTHGGQVSVEILDQHVNVARFFTPYVYGIYREPNSAIYVTRGVGTIGMPVRVGAPPEIALIRLCAT